MLTNILTKRKIHNAMKKDYDVIIRNDRQVWFLRNYDSDRFSDVKIGDTVIINNYIAEIASSLHQINFL